MVGPLGDGEGLAALIAGGEEELEGSPGDEEGDAASEGELEVPVGVGSVVRVSEGVGDTDGLGDGDSVGDTDGLGLGDGDVSANAVAGPAISEAPNAHTTTRVLSIRLKPDTARRFDLLSRRRNWGLLISAFLSGTCK